MVREYFELHGFFVRQQRKYVARGPSEEEEVDFLVLNPQPRPGAGPLPFVLGSQDLPFVTRAVVVVKGWHTETFTSGRLVHAPQIFRFVAPAAYRQAARAFGDAGPLLKILVVPGLPQSAPAREQSIQMLQSRGIDAVIPFHAMLADLIEQIEVNRNYQKADLLQVIRILKNYDFFKEPQLELFKPRRRRKARPEKPASAPPS